MSETKKQKRGWEDAPKPMSDEDFREAHKGRGIKGWKTPEIFD